MILPFMVYAIMATPILLAIIFMPTYLTKILHFNDVQVSNSILWVTMLSVIAIYTMGVLANRFSLLKLMNTCLVGIILGAGLCYWMLSKNYNLTFALSLFAIFQGALVVFPPIFLSALFPIQIRLTGVALSYNIAFVLFGGLTPIVVTTLVEHTHMPYMSPFICLLIVSLIAFVALCYYQKFIRNGALS